MRERERERERERPTILDTHTIINIYETQSIDIHDT
jgi:hypothetical protein